MTLPKIVSRDEWTAARTALLVDEKAQTRARDALNVRRRELPMVEIENVYVFEGPEGKVSLLDLFNGRRQLMVGHFMFDPDWDAGCPSCSAGADEWSPGLQRHLATRATELFHVTIDASVAPPVYNYGPVDDPAASGEVPGMSCFLRDGDRVFHTYSQYARGAESTGGSYYFLDLTALGRQEEWEEPKGRADVARSASPDFQE